MLFKNYKIDDITYIENLKKEVKKNVNSNFSYKTNVKGKMTDWSYFSNKNNIFKKVEDLLFEYKIYQAWGTILNKGDYVVEHDHTCTNLTNFYINISGVIYLTDVGPGTYFKEFNKTIKPEIGKIIVFNSEYRHAVEKYDKNEDRITIGFNGRRKEAYEF